MKIFNSIDDVIAKIESFLIVSTLSVMIFLSLSQVILRNIFEQGLPWVDLLLRQLVLWVAFLGASLATRKDKHLSIDFLKHLLPLNWNRRIAVLPLMASAIISTGLSYYAWVFVQYEKEGGLILYGNLPVWIFQIILPISITVIAFRFFLKTLNALLKNFSLSTHPIKK
jgi:C4-dicarboxylate transporter, DctQ subunit